MSQVTKLNYIDQKIGANATRKGQQTTRVLYDTSLTTLAAGGVLPRYFEFFRDGANKTINTCNLPTGKLDSGEAMVIKQIEIQCAGGSFYSATNSILNVYIGNQCVLKDFNMGTQWSTNNGPMERLYAQDGNGGRVAAIRLLTDIVLPPQVDLKVTYQVPGNVTLTPGTGAFGYQIRLRGYGVLFNAGSSF